MTTENAKIKVYAEEETSEDEVEVTDNGDGSYTLETPRANNTTNIILTVSADGDAVVVNKSCMFRLFHAGELQLRSLFVDGVAVDAAVRNAINTGDAYTATLSGNIYTHLPSVTAVANDGTEPEVSAGMDGTTAVYTIKGADRTFTLHIEGVYLYTMGDKDEEYRITYSADGKSAYDPQDKWTDGWTDGLYTLRTTSLDGWGGQQFKFNAADNVLEVPGGVVVKTFTLEKYGANYGDGEGLTSMSSEGATFRIPTNHGYTRGGRDNLTVMVENHKAGEPIAFTITGGNLAVLMGLLATPFNILKPGHILIIEDVAEQVYQVQRLLYHLRLAGILPHLAGLVVGQFTKHRGEETTAMVDMIADMVAPYHYPVAFNFPIGHIARNIPIVEGATATLEVNDAGSTLLMHW